MSEETSPSARETWVKSLKDPRNFVLLILAGAGLVLFSSLLARGIQRMDDFSLVERALSQLTDQGSQNWQNSDEVLLQERRAFPSPELEPAFSLIWVALLSLGVWGWMLIERSFLTANPTIEILLRRAAMLGLGLLLYVLVGFDLNYPSGFFRDFIPHPSLGKEWASTLPNLLFQSLAPAVILTSLAGYAICGARTRYLLTLTVLVSLVLFPLTASWIWDSKGWLHQLNAVDFAGAGVIHLLSGMLGLTVLLGTRWSNHEPLPREKMSESGAITSLPGLVIIQFAFAALLGGAVTTSSGDMMVRVLVIGGTAALTGAITAGISRFRFHIRPWIHTLFIGSMSGWVIISAGAPGFTVFQAAILGAIAGGVTIVGMATLDTLELRDPFAVVPAQGVCGAIGLAVAGWGDIPGVDFFLQLVAIGAIAAPPLLVGMIVMVIFVKTKRLSKRDPSMPES